MSRLSEADCIIICVPTPLNESRDPDLSYIEGTAASIAKVLRPGQLVVLESTTHPTTTRTNVWPVLEATGLRCGTDYFLAFSPEREDPGNPHFQAATIPKVVGGFDESSADLACAMYSHAVVKVVRVSTMEVAEACKILENTYRAVNIALVNELKVLYDKLGIDVWEVIDAAKTKPFGFQAFYPGQGSGGTAFRSIRSISPGWRASTASRRGSSSWPARSTRTCRSTSSTGSPSFSTNSASRSTGARLPFLAWPTRRTWTIRAKARRSS